MNIGTFKSIQNSLMSVYSRFFVGMITSTRNLFCGQEQSLELLLCGQDILQTSQIQHCTKTGAVRIYNFIIQIPAMSKHYNALMERISVGLLRMQTAY